MLNFEKELVEIMVKEGLFDGTVKLIEDDLGIGILGVGCKIGDYAFYFLSSEDEYLTLYEIKKKYNNNDLANQITSAIYDAIDEDECDYYISYLDEKYHIVGNFRIDYYSRSKNFYVYKIVNAKNYDEAIKKSRIKNITDITLVSYEITKQVKNS